MFGNISSVNIGKYCRPKKISRLNLDFIFQTVISGKFTSKNIRHRIGISV